VRENPKVAEVLEGLVRRLKGRLTWRDASLSVSPGSEPAHCCQEFRTITAFYFTVQSAHPFRPAIRIPTSLSMNNVILSWRHDIGDPPLYADY